MSKQEHREQSSEKRVSRINTEASSNIQLELIVTMAAKLQQNSTIKNCNKTNNLIPNSTNLSQCQHCLPVNFNNFIFSSTIFSQHQLHKLLNFNIVISLKINGKNSTQKKFLCCWINTCSYPIFNYLKPVKINNSKFVSTNCVRAGLFLPRESGES